MDIEIDILKKSRELTLKAIDGLTIEQLNKIPKGFNNNIMWNVAHLVVAQQLLFYKLSGLESYISDEMIDTFRKGTTPSYTISKGEFEIIKEHLIELPTLFEKDFYKDKFKHYREYKTSKGIVLSNIDEAISFNNYHEGMHYGIILQLKKLV